MKEIIKEERYEVNKQTNKPDNTCPQIHFGIAVNSLGCVTMKKISQTEYFVGKA